MRRKALREQVLLDLPHAPRLRPAHVDAERVERNAIRLVELALELIHQLEDVALLVERRRGGPPTVVIHVQPAGLRPVRRDIARELLRSSPSGATPREEPTRTSSTPPLVHDKHAFRNGFCVILEFGGNFWEVSRGLSSFRSSFVTMAMEMVMMGNSISMPCLAFRQITALPVDGFIELGNPPVELTDDSFRRSLACVQAS